MAASYPVTQEPSAPLGPVSAQLARELEGVIRRHKTVFWLDSTSAYSGFVDALAARHRAGEAPYPVVGFRGSYLETILELQAYGSSLDKPSLLVHLPGFRPASVRETPLLEMYEPSHPFEKSLETLVREAATGRVAPDRVEAYAKSPGLSLEGADAWLADQLAGRAASQSELARWLEATSLGVVVEELLGRDTCLDAKLKSEADFATLQAFLHRQTGLDEAWRAACLAYPQQKLREQIAFALAAWLLCVEFVHDLTRAPRFEKLASIASLSKPLVDTCTALVRALRERHADAYAAWADLVQSNLLDTELSELRAEELGQVDTFRREERRVLHAAIESLQRGEWKPARDWAKAREGKASFWLERDQYRRWEWLLVGHAAAFAEALARHARPLEGARSLEEAVDVYRKGAFEVDRAHRRFEQERLRLLDPQLEHHLDLKEGVTRVLRERYRAWADQLAGDFAALCRAGSFLPERSLQQRTFYEEVVQPLTTGGERVVVFLVDAFRYEMATELLEDVRGGGAQVELRARLAELPTITAVGMNVLAPVAEGTKLQILVSEAGAFKGFTQREAAVATPAQRANSMGRRSLGRAATLLTLAQVCDEDAAQLRKMIASSKLVVVQSREIDDAGEANLGLQTFEQSLKQLRMAFTHLQAAGVKQFVFTADHGFLMQDSTTATRDWGERQGASRRHVYSRQLRQEPGLSTVPLTQLGYEGDSGYLLFGDDTAIFSTGTPGASFVHGGNSLQERVIPVLTVTRKREASPSLSAYKVAARGERDVLGARVIRVQVELAREQTVALGFVAKTHLELALRVPGRPEIEVIVRDAAEGASRLDDRLRLAVGGEEGKIYFTLRGPIDERLPVEIYCPDGNERVASTITAEQFAVEAARASQPASATPLPPSAAPGPPSTRRWQDAIGDAGAVAIFTHIEQHGSITEGEVIALLKSPRAARAFSLGYEAMAERLPFRVTTRTEQGKMYVKDGDR